MGPTSLAATTARPTTDIVLEGGGVKGIALVGAVEVLAEAGYSFARVGGSSAGAITGAVLAAMSQGGEPLGRLADIAKSLDYAKFRDRGFPGRFLGPLGLLTDGLSVLFESGAYQGDYLRHWLSGVLGDLGVTTFGDLRVEDPGADGGVHHRYRLVVTASDLSRHRLVYFPWEYADYGLDPDEQHVVDAVRASASIPFFFEPVRLAGAHGTSTLVDGGLVSNYPISMFDREDGKAPRWPTVGVRLQAPEPTKQADAAVVHGPIALGLAVVQTAIEGCQAEHVLAPCNVERSIFVDTDPVGATDFGLSEAQQQALLASGRRAATSFLDGWDFDRWAAHCQPAATTQG